MFHLASNITILENFTSEPNVSLTTSDISDLFDQGIPGYVKWVEGVTYIIRMFWFVISLIGNTLTLVAIWKFEYLWIPSSYNLISLAVGDLISAFNVPFAMVRDLLISNVKGSLWMSMCVISLLTYWVGACGNIISIFSISVERYIFVHRPLRYYSVVTKIRIQTCLLIFWIYWVILLISFIIVAIPQVKDIGVCSLAVIDYPCLNCVVQPQFWMFAIPTVILFSRIGYTAYKQSRAIHQMQGTEGVTPTQKVTKMLGLVLGVYWALNIPAIVYAALGQNCNTGLFECIGMHTTLVIYQVNVWINPIIFYVKNSDLRKAYRSLVHLN